MKLKSILFAAMGTALLFSATSCKKSSDSSNDLTADGLESGKAIIEFKTNRSFGGITHFVSNMNAMSMVTKGTMASTDLYTLNAFRSVNTEVGTAQLTFNISPQGANTSGGNLTGNFGGNAGVIATMVFSNGDAMAGNTESFAMVDGGSVTITKLTDEVIEGVFSGEGINQTTNESIQVSEGKFAARF
jgi:hypothetical protein